VKNPLKILSDKDINANLRYKTGKNLTYDPSKVVETPYPEKFGLPSANLSSRYILLWAIIFSFTQTISIHMFHITAIHFSTEAFRSKK